MERLNNFDEVCKQAFASCRIRSVNAIKAEDGATTLKITYEDGHEEFCLWNMAELNRFVAAQGEDGVRRRDAVFPVRRGNARNGVSAVLDDCGRELARSLA